MGKIKITNQGGGSDSMIHTPTGNTLDLTVKIFGADRTTVRAHK